MPYGYSPLKLVPAGPWAPDGVYVAGQVLVRNGSTYWAHRTPTVGNDPEINSPDEWQLLAAKGTKGDRGDVVWRGPHSMGTLYEVDDAVESGGSAWIATVQNQGHAPPDPNYWDLFAAAGGQGPAGSAWYVGSGVPSAETGNDGDRYLDGVAGNVYAKADGAWSLSGSLKGPAGAPGADGVCSVPVLDEADKTTGAIDRTAWVGLRWWKVGGAGVTSIDGHGTAPLPMFEVVASPDLTALDLHGRAITRLTLGTCPACTTVNLAGCALTAEQVAAVLAWAVAIDAVAASGGTLDLGGENAPIDDTPVDIAVATNGDSETSPDISGGTWTSNGVVNGKPSWSATIGEAAWYLAWDSEQAHWTLSTSPGVAATPCFYRASIHATGLYYVSGGVGGHVVSGLSYPQPYMDYQTLVAAGGIAVGGTDLSPNITGGTWVEGEEVNGAPSWSATLDGTTWYVARDGYGSWHISTTPGSSSEPGWFTMAQSDSPVGLEYGCESYTIGGPVVSNAHPAWSVTQPS